MEKYQEYNLSPKALTPPFIIQDRASILGNPMLALERGFLGWGVVLWSIPSDGIKILSHFALDDVPGRYSALMEATPDQVDKLLQKMKRQAIEHGASPDAIRLLSNHVKFKKKELEIMAKKLSTKADKAKAEKPAKADKAPKAKKGSAAGAAKARAAKEAGPDTRKIKVLEKENPYRAESNRAASWDALKGAKTVEDYKEAGGAVKYISRWESEGKISLA